MIESLLTRFASTPVLMPPENYERFKGCLLSLARVEKLDLMLAERADNNDGFWPAPDDWRAAYRPYVVTADGVLQIPVKGVLLHDFSFAIGSWATGYIYIQRAFERGMEDPLVRGIALMCDSPGGEVAGCFDMVDKLVAIRDQKPVWAFAHESAYSAAYATASVAKKIWVSRTGGVGSIGVYTMHVDYSGMLKQAGLAVTFIDAPEGGHKIDGNPYEPLSADVKARIQGRIDELYGIFVSSVARNRGMKEQAVRDTQALTFSASQATSNGLADAIGSLDDAVAAFVADLSCDDEQGEDDMTDKTKDEAAAEHAAALVTARAEGVKEGATAAYARVSAIRALDEAKDRGEFALTLALTTDLSVEQAKALLAKTPATPAAAAPKTDAFAAAMEASGNPNVGTETAEAKTDDEMALSQRIIETAYGKARK